MGRHSQNRRKARPDVKVSVNLGDIIGEVNAEADRQDRSISWLLQHAWLISREKIRQIPSAVT